jgi:hypothetical protein
LSRRRGAWVGLAAFTGLLWTFALVGEAAAAPPRFGGDSTSSPPAKSFTKAELKSKCVPMDEPNKAIRDVPCEPTFARLGAPPGGPTLFYQLMGWPEQMVTAGVVVLTPSRAGLTPRFWSYCVPCDFEEPQLIRQGSGWLLHLPGHVDGSARPNEDTLYRLDHGRWSRVRLPAETDWKWTWPAGYEERQGVAYDFKDMTATTAIFTGGGDVVGSLTYRLALERGRVAIKSAHWRLDRRRP